MFVELVRFGGQPPSESGCYPIDSKRYLFSALTGELCPADKHPHQDAQQDALEFAIFGSDQGAAWLENHCRAIACHVNGLSVETDERWQLRVADVIEIGIAALTIRQDAGDAAPAGAAVLADLTALAGPSAQSAPADFSDLIAMAGDYAQSARYHDSPTAGTPLSILDNAPVAAMHLPGDTDDKEGDDPLAMLTVEYRRALLHHERSHMHNLKVEHASTALRAPDDPFLDAPERFAEGSLLDDLLGDRQHINTLLKELDTFGEQQLFAADERQEILALLAPRELAAQRVARAAQLARQEHHMISVDSHFQLSADMSTQPEPPHDDRL